MAPVAGQSAQHPLARVTDSGHACKRKTTVPLRAKETARNRRRSYVGRMDPSGTVRRLAGGAREDTAVGTRASSGPDVTISRVSPVDY